MKKATVEVVGLQYWQTLELLGMMALPSAASVPFGTTYAASSARAAAVRSFEVSSIVGGARSMSASKQPFAIRAATTGVPAEIVALALTNDTPAALQAVAAALLAWNGEQPPVAAGAGAGNSAVALREVEVEEEEVEVEEEDGSPTPFVSALWFILFSKAGVYDNVGDLAIAAAAEQEDGPTPTLASLLRAELVRKPGIKASLEALGGEGMLDALLRTPAEGGAVLTQAFSPTTAGGPYPALVAVVRALVQTAMPGRDSLPALYVAVEGGELSVRAVLAQWGTGVLSPLAALVCLCFTAEADAAAALASAELRGVAVPATLATATSLVTAFQTAGRKTAALADAVGWDGDAFKQLAEDAGHSKFGRDVYSDNKDAALYRACEKYVAHGVVHLQARPFQTAREAQRAVDLFHVLLRAGQGAERVLHHATDPELAAFMAILRSAPFDEGAISRGLLLPASHTLRDQLLGTVTAVASEAEPELEEPVGGPNVRLTVLHQAAGAAQPQRLTLTAPDGKYAGNPVDKPLDYHLVAGRSQGVYMLQLDANLAVRKPLRRRASKRQKRL